MKPPICYVCQKDFRRNIEEGGLIYFNQTAENKQWHKDQEERHFVGHPPEAAWFCGEHYAAAKELGNLTLPEALHILKEQFKIL